MVSFLYGVDDQQTFVSGIGALYVVFAGFTVFLRQFAPVEEHGERMKVVGPVNDLRATGALTCESHRRVDDGADDFVT